MLLLIQQNFIHRLGSTLTTLRSSDLVGIQLASNIDSWFVLVRFNGISTIAGNLMQNPFYTYKQFYSNNSV